MSLQSVFSWDLVGLQSNLFQYKQNRIILAIVVIILYEKSDLVVKKRVVFLDRLIFYDLGVQGPCLLHKTFFCMALFDPLTDLDTSCWTSSHNASETLWKWKISQWPCDFDRDLYTNILVWSAHDCKVTDMNDSMYRQHVLASVRQTENKQKQCGDIRTIKISMFCVVHRLFRTLACQQSYIIAITLPYS